MAARAEIVDRTAADWLARRDSGEWSRAEQAEFERWLAEATEHRLAWLRLEAAWERADILRPRPQAEPRPAWKRRRWAAAAAAVVVATSSLVAAQALPRSYATPVGGARTEALADGARVQLNTDTKILVSRGDQKPVRLQKGEAYFVVPAEQGRSLIVDAGEYEIAAEGAAFAVRRQHDRVAVTVETGQVAVRRRGAAAGSAPAVICRAGEVLYALPEATRIVSRSPEKVQEALGWRRGLVIFDDSRLADVAAEFNRYNETKLVIADPTLAEARVGGAFRAGNLEAFVRILAQDVGAKATRHDDQILLSSG